ncbi:MAG: protein TolQ [Pelagibacterales bacterium]|jgi:biopolymer transport protein TolQ|nr:protein TolQ [Pelagibacteraceae bacterium]MDG2417164.1 protein TolQ [Pelagibacterales bacterium]|tara:strand:- start:2574 stop:3284 length:711 start_codon:yes stop_codon:yes gene_type:complete
MDNDLITAGQISDEFTLMSLFFRADLVVKLVILILFAASIFSWTIIIHKIRLFRSLNKLTKSFEEIFWSGKSLKSISLDAADISDSPIRSVFLDAIDEVEKSKTISSKNYESVSKRIERVMDASIDLETEKLSENFGYLATIGSTTPFIGLFGTVWGIMNSFQSIAISRNTSLAVVAPGIAEALFATALGLLAAIPAVIAYNIFTNQVNDQNAKMYRFKEHFSVIFSRSISSKNES